MSGTLSRASSSQVIAATIVSPRPATSGDEQYLDTALRLQRWRDFAAHLTAYLVMNLAFVTVWWLNHGGYFWPAWTIVGWGLGLSFQHFQVVLRGFITDSDVRREISRLRGPEILT